MPVHFDVIVLGVGAMGAATCSELARRGARVLGLERFDVPHALGSSGGQTRLIRKAYFEHPDYVPLLHRTYELWQQAEERAGEQLLHRTGLVCAGPADGSLIAGVRRAAREHGLAIDEVIATEVPTLARPLRVPERFVAMFEPDAGFLLCERAIETFVDDALRHGAVIRAREPALGFSVEGGGAVDVRTARGHYRGARLVVTAGAWSSSLLRSLGLDLRVTRQAVGWTWPRSPSEFDLGTFPCWAIEDDAPGFTGLYYGFPILPASRFAGARGLKAGHHHVGPAVDPTSVDRAMTPTEEAGFRTGLTKFLPDANGPLLGARVCLYTMSPDGHFIVDRHLEHETVVVACGFSGHGFKFAPVIGEALADLTLEGRTGLPIEFLGLGRFGS